MCRVSDGWLYSVYLIALSKLAAAVATDGRTLRKGAAAAEAVRLQSFFF